jgi:hypothetical protein
MKKALVLIRIIIGGLSLVFACKVISIKCWPTVEAQTTSVPATIQSLSGDQLVMPDFAYTFNNKVFNSRYNIYMRQANFTSLEPGVFQGKNLPVGSKFSLHVNSHNPAQYYFPSMPPSEETFFFAISIAVFILSLLPWGKILSHNNSFKPTRAHTARAA